MIFVFSTADQKVVRKQRQKHIDRIREGLEKTQQNVARGGPYSDEDSVTRRVTRLFADKDAAKYFSWKMFRSASENRSNFPRLVVAVAGRRIASNSRSTRKR